MFCRFHSTELLLQKLSSVLASALMVSLWNQDFRWFSKAYKLLVINLATGPKAIDMEIILPIILAICFAGIASLSSMLARVFLNASILWSETDTVPWDKSRLNPNQVKLCVGFHWDFSMFTINPAHWSVVWIVLLACIAASRPEVATISSSRYTTAFNPCPFHHLTNGLSSLVNITCSSHRRS